MKPLTPGTGQKMVIVWAAYLLFLLFMHMMNPNDRWAAMFCRPIFLVLAPLFVACLPLLAALPTQQGVNASRLQHAGGGEVYSDDRRTAWNKVRKMVMAWLASLVIFASPHGTTMLGLLDSVLHRPVFLIVAPLLLAGFPLMAPISDRNRSLRSAGSNRRAFARRRVEREIRLSWVPSWCSWIFVA